MCPDYFRWISALAVVAVSFAEEHYELSECGGKPADVFFVLDSSGSIVRSDFLKELSFTEDVASMLDINDHRVRVGLLSFSKTVEPQFGLGEYSDKADMLNKISATVHLGGGTNTGEALSYLHEKGMSPDKLRDNIPHIAIVLTDGMSQSPNSTVVNAKRVHDAGITVFVVGIGSQVDNIELEAIGSKPSSEYVFKIDNFDALTHIRRDLAIRTCEAKPVTPAPNIQNTEAEVDEELAKYGRCVPRKSLDIVFAVDTAAVGGSNTKFVLQFIANVSDRIGMAVSQTTVTTIDNGCAGGNINGEPATDNLMVRESLSTYKTPEFYQLMRNMRLKAVDGRMQSAHVGVVFATDRLSPAEFRKARLESLRANFQQTSIFVLGIGNRVDADQYGQLTCNGGQFITVDSFEGLEKMGNEVLRDLCTFGIK